MTHLYANHQWVVTRHGMESRRDKKFSLPDWMRREPYWIEKERLLEFRPGSEHGLYDWPLHMADKVWVDPRAFFDCWLQACKIHKVALDDQILEATRQKLDRLP